MIGVRPEDLVRQCWAGGVREAGQSMDVARAYKRRDFVPAWQDTPTLCAHLCISDTTLDAWVRQGILPPPRQIGGKRMWKWRDVETRLEGGPERGQSVESDAERIKNATRAATGA